MKLWQLSLSFGFNFQLSCLRAVTAATTDTGLAAFMCCVPHGGHITASEMVRNFPSRHFIQHLALWGRLQAPVEVCVLHAATHLREGHAALADLHLGSLTCSSWINICPRPRQDAGGLLFTCSTMNALKDSHGRCSPSVWPWCPLRSAWQGLVNVIVYTPWYQFTCLIFSFYLQGWGHLALSLMFSDITCDCADCGTAIDCVCTPTYAIFKAFKVTSLVQCHSVGLQVCIRYGVQ